MGKISKKPIIQIVKLNNGEVLISGLNFKGKKAVLSRPMAIFNIPSMNRKGEVSEECSLFIRNWVDSSETLSYTISRDFVLTTGTPDRTTLDLYRHALLCEDMNACDEYLLEAHIEIEKRNALAELKKKEAETGVPNPELTEKINALEFMLDEDNREDPDSSGDDSSVCECGECHDDTDYSEEESGPDDEDYEDDFDDSGEDGSEESAF